MGEVSYSRLTRDLARVLCPHVEHDGPCQPCWDAAYRVVVHRSEVRRLLSEFARRQRRQSA